MKEYNIQDFLEIKSAFSPSFSPDDKNICYLSNITGTNQIYLISIDGKNNKQLTNTKDSISFAKFSPKKMK